MTVFRGVVPRRRSRRRSARRHKRRQRADASYEAQHGVTESLVSANEPLARRIGFAQPHVSGDAARSLWTETILRGPCGRPEGRKAVDGACSPRYARSDRGFVALLLIGVAPGSRHYTIAGSISGEDAETERGRAIIVELPTGPGLTLFSSDSSFFYYGSTTIDKRLVTGVQVLINGSPIASYESQRQPASAHRPPTSFEDRPEGIARDRWDVAIVTSTGAVMVECGAIRERVSQELARSIFDAVRADLERRDVS